MPLDRYPVATRLSPPHTLGRPYLQEGADSPHPLPRSRPGLVVESRAPGLDQHQFQPAPAAIEQSGASTNSSNPLCRQICDAYGPLFRFLAPW